MKWTTLFYYHFACHTIEFFLEKDLHHKLGTAALGWTGNSPDFSPIENLWEISKVQLTKGKISWLRMLNSAIEKCWYVEISIGLLRSLIDSIPSRIEQVIRNKG